MIYTRSKARVRQLDKILVCICAASSLYQCTPSTIQKKLVSIKIQKQESFCYLMTWKRN